MTQRLGILGGTFNPIHMGHLLIAQSALEAHDLAKVVFIPCATPPHKRTPSLAPAANRMAMVNAAIAGDVRFESSDLEIARGGPSYAIDTVRVLRREHPDCELCFVIGSDSLRELHLWKDIAELLRLCRFLTVLRPGHEPAKVAEPMAALPDPWPQRLRADFVSGKQMDISSSEIRHRIAEGMSIRYLVPDAVEMYIAEHHLYDAIR